MARDDQGWARVDFARWFLDHDEVDEAARVLEPGDELDLGRSDQLDLRAALARRGLSGTSEQRRLRVLGPDPVPGENRGPALAGELAASTRKPPVRGPNVPASPASTMKKTGG